MVAFDPYNNLLSEGWFPRTHFIAKEIGSWRRGATCLSSLSWLRWQVRWGLGSSVCYARDPLLVPVPIVLRSLPFLSLYNLQFSSLFPWVNGTQGFHSRHSGHGLGRKGRKSYNGASDHFLVSSPQLDSRTEAPSKYHGFHTPNHVLQHPSFPRFQITTYIPMILNQTFMYNHLHNPEHTYTYIQGSLSISPAFSTVNRSVVTHFILPLPSTKQELQQQNPPVHKVFIVMVPDEIRNFSLQPCPPYLPQKHVKFTPICFLKSRSRSEDYSLAQNRNLQNIR